MAMKLLRWRLKQLCSRTLDMCMITPHGSPIENPSILTLSIVAQTEGATPRLRRDNALQGKHFAHLRGGIDSRLNVLASEALDQIIERCGNFRLYLFGTTNIERLGIGTCKYEMKERSHRVKVAGRLGAPPDLLWCHVRRLPDTQSSVC